MAASSEISKMKDAFCIFGRVVFMIEEISCGRLGSIAWVTPCSIGGIVLFPFSIGKGCKCMSLRVIRLYLTPHV